MCPRSASCSPINIMPYKAAHSRNPMERPKLFVTPPEGSARRRTVHGTAVSSCKPGDGDIRPPIRPTSLESGWLSGAVPTLPPHLAILLPPENLNLKMKIVLCSSMSEWLNCHMGASIRISAMPTYFIFESKKTFEGEVGLDCCLCILFQPCPEAG